MYSKRGQFYLMAAVIIVAIVVSLASVVNYSERTSYRELYDLGEELKIESEEVLDYGIYNSLSESDLSTLLTDFTMIYTDYKGDARDLYFVFGDRHNLTVAGYRESEDLTPIPITLNMTNNAGVILPLGELSVSSDGNYISATYEITGNPSKIILTVEDIRYEFDFSSEQYFYFIIAQKIGGEHYIVTNERD